MGKIKKRVIARRAQKSIQRHSLVLGLLSDILFTVGLVMKIVNWPVHTFARWVNRESRHYPELRILQSHLFVSVTSGALVLVGSFFVADWFHHAVWSATIETARAAGVCPIWALIETKFVRI
jgi:hypothetical protein